MKIRRSRYCQPCVGSWRGVRRDDVSDGRNGRALNTLAEEYAIYFGATPISKLRLLEIAVAVVSGLLDQDDDLAESTEERPEIPQANNQIN